MICDQLTRDASSMTLADFDEIYLGNWLPKSDRNFYTLHQSMADALLVRVN